MAAEIGLSWSSLAFDLLISGPPQQTEWFMYEGDTQRKVHCVADYIRGAPVNFCVTTPQQSMLGFPVRRCYTVH